MFVVVRQGQLLNASLSGTDDELAERVRTHDDYILNQKQKRRSQEARLEDAEESIRAARSSHVELMSKQGELHAEERVYFFLCPHMR